MIERVGAPIHPRYQETSREHHQDANENRVTDKTCRQRYSQSTNGVHGGPSCVVIGLKPITRTNESTVTDLGGN